MSWSMTPPEIKYEQSWNRPLESPDYAETAFDWCTGWWDATAWLL